MVIAKDKVTFSGLKMLETIISLTPHGGQTFLDEEFMGSYSKWKD